MIAHGDERTDDWAWLRSDDRSDPEVLALLEAENDFVDEALAHTDDLQAELFAEMKARIKETDLSVPFRKGGRWFYSRTEEGQQYPILCRTDVEPPGDLPEDDADARRGGAARPERAGRRQRLLRAWAPTTWPPAQDLLLYSTDHDGSERYTMRVRDLRTGDDLPDVIPRDDLRLGLGGRRHLLLRPSGRRRCAPTRCGATRSGTDTADDVLVYEDPDERFFVSVGLSLTEAWVHISSSSKVTTEEHLIPAADPTAAARVRAAPRAGRRVRRHPRPEPASTATGSSSSPTPTTP